MAFPNGAHGGNCTWSINPKTQEIEAEVLTENSGHDADQVEPLLDEIETPINSLAGDGAYDQWKVYQTLADQGD